MSIYLFPMKPYGTPVPGESSWREFPGTGSPGDPKKELLWKHLPGFLREGVDPRNLIPRFIPKGIFAPPPSTNPPAVPFMNQHANTIPLILMGVVAVTTMDWPALLTGGGLAAVVVGD